MLNSDGKMLKINKCFKLQIFLLIKVGFNWPWMRVSFVMRCDFGRYRFGSLQTIEVKALTAWSLVFPRATTEHWLMLSYNRVSSS